MKPQLPSTLPRGTDAAASTRGGSAQADASAGYFASLLGRLRARRVMSELSTPEFGDEGSASRREERTQAQEPLPMSMQPTRAAVPVRRGEDQPPTVRAIDTPTERGVLRHVEAAAEQDRVVERLVSSISDFCNDPSTQGREGWTVRLELSPSVLPQTELEVSLSPQWLLLRFSPRDPQSRALVSAGSQSLQSSLESAMNPKRDVAVDIE
jgi:hypothetical protein